MNRKLRFTFAIAIALAVIGYRYLTDKPAEAPSKAPATSATPAELARADARAERAAPAITRRLGKIAFTPEQLRDNTAAIINAVRKAKPAAAKGKYVRSIYISSTMSPSIQLDSALAETKEA